MTCAHDAGDKEQNHIGFDDLLPGEPFELPAVLAMFRAGRDSGVGPDIGARMDRATAELEAAHSLRSVPSAGDPAPAFELPNQSGQPVSLAGLVAAGPVVMVFYRGVWCPYCNVTLRAYQQHASELRALGASIVAISPQLPDKSLDMAERNALDYDVLSDVGAVAARAYGLAFRIPDYLVEAYRRLGHPLPAFNGTDTWELPIPATFVIDRQAIVRFSAATPDYTQRADPADLVKVLCDLT